MKENKLNKTLFLISLIVTIIDFIIENPTVLKRPIILNDYELIWIFYEVC